MSIPQYPLNMKGQPQEVQFIEKPGILTAEQHNIVNKFVELSEVINSHKIFDVSSPTYNPAIAARSFEKSAVQFQFSDQTIASVSEQIHTNKLQLAGNNDVAPLIGATTLATLPILIQEIGTSTDLKVGIDEVLPDRNMPMRNIIVDRYDPNAGIAAEYGGYNSMVPTVKPLNSRIQDYSAGLWAVKAMFPSNLIFWERERGATLGGFSNRGIGQVIAYNTVNLVTQCLVRKSKLKNDAVFQNEFTYGGATIASNIPTENYFQMDSMGTLDVGTQQVTYSNPSPLYNPIRAINAIIADPRFIRYRPYIKGILLNGQDLVEIMNHPNVKAITNLIQANSQGKAIDLVTSGTTNTITKYFAAGFTDFPLYGDNSTWVPLDSNGIPERTTSNYFVPRGKMFVMLGLDAQHPMGAFHLTYNEMDPNTVAPAMGQYVGLFQRNFSNSDVSNRFDLYAGLAGAPAIYMPEAFFIIDKLYSNV